MEHNFENEIILFAWWNDGYDMASSKTVYKYHITFCAAQVADINTKHGDARLAAHLLVPPSPVLMGIHI